MVGWSLWLSEIQPNHHFVHFVTVLSSFRVSSSKEGATWDILLALRLEHLFLAWSPWNHIVSPLLIHLLTVIYLFCWDRVSLCCSGWPQTHSLSWDFRCLLPCLAWHAAQLLHVSAQPLSVPVPQVVGTPKNMGGGGRQGL